MEKACTQSLGGHPDQRFMTSSSKTKLARRTEADGELNLQHILGHIRNCYLSHTFEDVSEFPHHVHAVYSCHMFCTPDPWHRTHQIDRPTDAYKRKNMILRQGNEARRVTSQRSAMASNDATAASHHISWRCAWNLRFQVAVMRATGL